MKSKTQVQSYLKDNNEALKELENDGDDRDWEAYDIIQTENEILEWVLK